MFKVLIVIVVLAAVAWGFWMSYEWLRNPNKQSWFSKNKEQDKK